MLLLMNNHVQLSYKGMSRIHAPLYDQMLVPPRNHAPLPARAFRSCTPTTQRCRLNSLRGEERYDRTWQYRQVSLDKPDPLQ